MTTPTRFDRIVSTLVAEAMEDPATGWLSNFGEYDQFDYAENDGAIYVNGNYESVDVYQLAGIVEALFEQFEKEH